MQTYTISYQYSNNGGLSWCGSTATVYADSALAAIEQVKSRAPLVKDIRILSVR